jgi:23S rRNA (cytidine1920-2'-O)/16S rRNA (cytidine1409-2'-O)-methyltransferase
MTPESRRKRLDLLLVESGLFSSREKARAAVMAGYIRRGTQILDKPGLLLPDLESLHVVQRDCPFVSRGGFKLAAALECFSINPQQRICLDIGASTGGFTDCLLQRGAATVYAIDTGYGQLDWRLRNDARVIVHEKCNARYLTAEQLYLDGQAFASLAVMDVSFISILKILPALSVLLATEGVLVSLIKPQFEASPAQNRKGIVRSEAVHHDVLTRMQMGAVANGFFLHQVIASPVLGKGGNREFLGLFYRFPPEHAVSADRFWEVIHEPVA